MSYRDETFNRAMEFVKNSQHVHPGVSNIYVFTAVDKDGNIVDEKYGMNLMTNTGFKAIYSTGTAFTASNSLKLYVGSGNSNIYVSDTKIETPAFGGLAATNSNTDKAYDYPMYYSKGEEDDNGLITLISRFLVAYYNYNIDNYPDPTYISEYGIGTAYTNLWTHSHIYDIKGQKANMLKNPNERLFITVYMCLSLYEHVIQNGWSQNRFTAITRNDIMYNRMYDSNLYTYKRGNKKVDRTGSPSRTMNTQDDNVFINSTIMPSFTMYDGADDNSGYFDGFIYYRTGMMIIEPQFLDKPEDIVLENYFSLAAARYTGFSEKFGTYPSSDYTKETYPPITQLSDVKVNLFNWKTKDWTNELKIYNPDDKWYDETPSSTTCALPIYYSNNGEIHTGYLYQNLRPDDEILEVSSGGITIYATDKYWDYNSWIWINDYKNIPDAAKKARFWITNNNTTSLTFVRKSDTFQLLDQESDVNEKNNGYDTYPEFTLVYGCYPQCDSYKYGWFLRNNKLYVPSTRQTFDIGNSGSNSSEHMVYDKWLITFNSVNNKIYVTDTSNATKNTVNPQETEISFNTNVNPLTQCYRTESSTGIICMQATNTQEANIINMKNGTVKHTIKKWKMSCCIWGTNKIAYIPADDANGDEDTNKIYIYDCTTDSKEDPIDFPESVTNVSFMVGHTKYLWFTNGTTYDYVVNIEGNKQPEGAENSIRYNSDLHKIKITAVDDVMIIYKSSDYGSNGEANARYIRITEENEGVKNPVAMSDFNNSNSYYNSRIDYVLRYIHGKNGTDTNHKTLMLLICRGYYTGASNETSGSSNRVIDFGQYLVTGNIQRWSYTANSCSNFTLFGENIIYRTQQKIPIPNFMPIKLEGKTKTISAFNNIKNVSNKQWLLSYTNQPSWGHEVSGNGKPPGVPLAVTDKDGTITGWS